MSDRTPLLPPRLSASSGRGVSSSQARSNVSTKSKQRDPQLKSRSKTGKSVPPAVASSKLGTFEGVFLPTSLNVLSILMFLRFGFIMGQMGISGTLLLLVMSYFIDILTTLSISAISTNGTVRGGGAYYMILRSLGPEFGVAIGIIFFIGQVLNSSLNVVGLIEPFLENFGAPQGAMLPLLPVTPLWQITYSTILLGVCTGVAMVGSSLVSKTAFWLFVVLTTSTLSIPVSALVVKPFYPLKAPNNNLLYTGISWATFLRNFWPEFTSNAAGSLQPPGVPETFRNMFGIFFPATAGIFAGASMSGELKTPSKSIPKGTLRGLLVTFILYFLVIVSIGSTTPRELLHKDVAIMQTINMHGLIIVLGEVSTSLFSVIMGIVGAASMLNAIANDKILPGLGMFAVNQKSGSDVKRAQLYGVIFTWFLAQIFLFADINQIATFITMAFSMTFMVTNLACFLLRLGSAPNFRPSFKYFSSKTALTGGVASVIAMYICDGRSATSVIVFLIFLIMVIHYSAPPLKFGDISQLLIYHQVRKYLLRLKLNMSVKYWRPQILLLCDDPRTCWNLIGFCNHLKKGGLYILGHVVIIPDDKEGNSLEFTIDAFKEVQRQKLAWVKLRNMARIKAFVQIAIGPSLPWGVRNVFLGSGLGGMKPNITMIGFHDFSRHQTPDCASLAKQNQPLPTDNLRKEKQVSISQWVQIVEELIIMQATVAVAANFSNMSVPELSRLWFSEKLHKAKNDKKYIDLYPIQMSTMCVLADGKPVLLTNFDTYTLILQLGSILSTVDEWKKNNYVLRILAFVENKGEENEERNRLEGLLDKLRIEAEVKVLCLSDGHLESYNILVSGLPITKDRQDLYDRISLKLQDNQWWINLVESRKIVREVEYNRKRNSSQSRSITINEDMKNRLNKISFSSADYHDLKNSFSESAGRKRRYTLSNLHGQGMSMSLNMRAQGGDHFYTNGDSIDSSDESSSERDVTVSETTSSNSSIFNATGIVRPAKTKKRGTAPQCIPLDGVNKAPMLQNKGPVSGLKMIYKNDQASASGERLPSRPLKVNLRPNFSAVKIPETRVQEDDVDECDEVGNDGDDETPRPSIVFVDEENESDVESNKDEDEEENEQDEGDKENAPGSNSSEGQDGKDGDNTFAGRTIDKPSHLEIPRKPSRAPSEKLLKTAGKAPRERTHFDMITDLKEDLRAPSIISVDMLHEHIQSPNFLRESDDELQAVGEADYFTRKEFLQKTQDLQVTFKKLQRELNEFLFNKLPPNGQHIILNDLMRTHLGIGETAVIFSTLPAPELGCHRDPDESFEYANSLSIWLEDLPPVVLLNSQTVTVTTSL